jgi:hypothetical protein
MVDLALLQSVSYIAGALGVCVAAAYYVMNLRTQQVNMKSTLDARQADFVLRLAQAYTTDLIPRTIDMIYNQKYTTFEEWVAKYRSDLQAYSNLFTTLHYLNAIGILLEEKLVNPEVLKRGYPPTTILLVWARAEPVIKGLRKMYGDDTLFRQFESLAMFYLKDNEHLFEVVSQRLSG